MKKFKIIKFIILGLSILIGFTVIEMLLRAEKIKNININFRKSAVIAIISILFISIILPNWPLATGDLNGRLTPTIMPDEFGDANSWLEDQPGDFKVIWMPKYNSQDVEWNSEHRTILDIASMSSSKPTYVFNNPHMQPNRYGIYSLSSIFGSYDHSIIVSNSTNELGKLLAPLGIKYILFHDDNATKPFMQNELLKNLLYQNDLKLVQKFGFIYIFENIHEFDHDASKIFATSNNNLILGGMETLATLNSIPDFDQRANGAFFSGQKSHDSDELNEYIDTIILTRSSELEDLALKYADEDYFIAPFDQCEHYAPWETWSKARTMDRNWLMTSRKSNLKAWDWEYDRGVVFTWATGTVQSESAFLNEDLIKFYNFETGLNNFTELTSNIDIYQSKYSTQGDWSLKGSIDKGRYINNQGAGSGFIPIPIDNRNLRFSLNLAAENAVNVQVRIKYYDEDQNYLGRDFVLTETGSFEFTKYEKDVTLADNVAYCSIQILADENPATNSYWWIDELKIFDLNNLIDPNALDIEFDIEKNNNYDIFIRILKGDTGGKVNLVIDDELVNSLETKSKNFGFSWECIESIYFEKGSHEVSIENDAGFNAVNLIAIIPIEKTEEYFENAEEFVENKDIIYLMEAENNFVFSNAKILMQYGSLASSGEVISFGENGSARLPLEILQSGNYTLALRLAKGRDSSNLNFTFANKTYRIRNTNNNDLEWIEFHDIYVENGTNEIKFESTPIQIFNLNLSFEYGWNDEKDAPVNWYAPRTEFSVGLDPRFKTDGNYSVRLTTDSQSSEILSHLKSRDIKIKPGIYYNISLDVKLDNIINTRVKIAGYNKTAQEWVYIDNIVAGLKGTKNWQTYFKRIFIPINISKINIIINAGTVSNPSRGNATAWFDAIQIQRLVEAKNIDLDLISLFLDVNNQSVQEHFTPKSEAAVLNYKKIDSTRYEVEIRSTAPFILVFAETFDEFWVAQGSGMDKIESVPVYGMLNGFYIEKTGNFSIIIEYEPQQWFNIGASITGISIAGSIGYFIWVDRKKWGDRFNKLIKRNEKIVKK